MRLPCLAAVAVEELELRVEPGVVLRQRVGAPFRDPDVPQAVEVVVVQPEDRVQAGGVEVEHQPARAAADEHVDRAVRGPLERAARGPAFGSTSATMPPPKLGSGLAVSKAKVADLQRRRARRSATRQRRSGFVSSLTSGSRSGGEQLVVRASASETARAGSGHESSPGRSSCSPSRAATRSRPAGETGSSARSRRGRRGARQEEPAEVAAARPVVADPRSSPARPRSRGSRPGSASCADRSGRRSGRRRSPSSRRSRWRSPRAPSSRSVPRR